MRREWEMWEEEGETLTWPHKPRHNPLVGGAGAIVAEQPERTVKGKGRKKFRLTLSGFGEAAKVVENRCGENLLITRLAVVAREKGKFNVRLGGLDVVMADAEEGKEIWTWKGFHNKSKAWWGLDNLLQVAVVKGVTEIVIEGECA